MSRTASVVSRMSQHSGFFQVMPCWPWPADFEDPIAAPDPTRVLWIGPESPHSVENIDTAVYHAFREALGFSAGGLQWVMSAYLLSFGGKEMTP